MENLKSFLDGELDLARTTEVEAQLRNNPNLESMATDFRSLSASLKTADAGVPYGLDKLQEKLAKTSAPRPSNSKVWKTSLLFSAIGGLMILFALPVLLPARSAAKKSTVASASEMSSSVAVSKPETKAQASGGLKMRYQDQESDGFEGELRGRQSRSPSEAKADYSVEGQVMNGAGGIKAEKAKMIPQSSGAMVPMTPGDSLSTPYGIYLERSGEASIKVEDLSKSVDQATGITKRMDGFVVSSNLSNSKDGGQAAMTLRIPTKSFSAAVNEIQAMGEVLSVNMSSQDITDETVENTSRMTSWAEEEQRLIEMLERARTTKDKLRIRNQLISVRANIQAFRAEVKSLRDRANFSTLNVTFVRGESLPVGMQDSGNWSGDAFKNAGKGLGEMFKVLGTVIIYTLVFFPIWLPLVIGAMVVRKRNR